MNTHNVVLPCGAVAGEDMGNYIVYRGIPYAQPPLGKLRWHAPQHHAGWDEVYDATRFRNRCWQADHKPGDFYYKEFYSDPGYTPPRSEDCLYLNIWVPKNQHNEKFPVAVWIHGGAFLHGWSSESEFDGAAYANRGIILVTINYRLGIFGFFSHPALSERDGVSGNYGILDQIAALDWVHANIEALGGDAENITVFGQSAGGMSVRTLVSSPLARGKFQRAIMQSSGGYKGPLSIDVKMKDMERIWSACLADAGMSFDILTEMPAQDLFALTGPFTEFASARMGAALCFVPVIDGVVLTCGYDEAVDLNIIHDVPYITGCTRDDIASENVDNENNPIFSRTIEWCRRVSSPTYMYYFTRQLPGDDAGAFHSAELWYLFDTFDRCWRPMTKGDKELSEEMLGHWVSFMQHGAPKQDWLPCNNEQAYVKEFDIRSGRQ